MILLLVDPWMSVSMGFALSVAATGGLFAYSLIQARSRRAREPSGSAADESALSGRATLTGPESLRRRGTAFTWRSVAIAAQLATLPIIASFGGDCRWSGARQRPGNPGRTLRDRYRLYGLRPFERRTQWWASVSSGLRDTRWWIAQVAHWSAGLPCCRHSVAGRPSRIRERSALVVIMSLLGWVYRKKVIRFLRANKRRSAVISVVVLVAGCVFVVTSRSGHRPVG